MVKNQLIWITIDKSSYSGGREAIGDTTRNRYRLSIHLNLLGFPPSPLCNDKTNKRNKQQSSEREREKRDSTSKQETRGIIIIWGEKKPFAVLGYLRYRFIAIQLSPSLDTLALYGLKGTRRQLPTPICISSEVIQLADAKGESSTAYIGVRCMILQS